MSTHLRTTLAIIAGVLVSLVLAYIGAVVHLLATRGIPLGMTPRETTLAEYLTLLLIVMVGGLAGGQVAVKTAPEGRRVIGSAMTAILVGIMLWGFWGSPAWPVWWRLAAALALAVGVWLGSSSCAMRGSANRPRS